MDDVDEMIESAGERGDMAQLRRLADAGNMTAADQLIELAAELGDIPELRRLSDLGNATATDQLIETATEYGNLDELRRLAATGNRTAAEQLAELTDKEQPPRPDTHDRQRSAERAPGIEPEPSSSSRSL